MPGETKGTRVIALVGPAGAGKTSLAEAILYASGTTDRQGSVANGSSIGDSSAEARQRGGSTETNLYNFTYLGEKFAIVDAPGSVGFSADATRGVAVADLAIVVVDPDPARAALAAPALRMLDEQGIPHLLFVNRIDQAHGRIRELLTALQPMSVSPLIARQIPIREGEKVTGFVDVALERAFHYVPGKPSEQIALPEELADREAQARTQLLEQLADHDDTLLEQLLMDEVPEPGTIFADLKRETSDNLGVSVLFGSAHNGWGVRRLLKALRHEAPGPEGNRAAAGGRWPCPLRLQGLPRRIGRAACTDQGDRRRRSTKAPTSRARATRPGALARCSRSRATRPPRSARPKMATSSRWPRPTASMPATGSVRASFRRPSKPRFPPAIARSRSSRRTARTTSACPARSPAFSRRTRACRWSRTRRATKCGFAGSTTSI